MIKIFYDLETTGLNPKVHGVHQIALEIEVDDILIEKYSFKVRPNPKAKLDATALRIGNVTKEQIEAYPEMKTVYKDLTKIFNKLVNKYDPADKMFLVGFNNRSFDDIFFRAWFDQCGSSFFGAYFWTDSLDVIVLASQYLLDRRASMPSFKLVRVAKELGLVVHEKKLHDASYDVFLTRQIYRIVTGLEMEF